MNRQTTNRLSTFNAYKGEITFQLDSIRQSLTRLDLADDISWSQIGDMNRVLENLTEVARVLSQTSR